MAFTIASSVTAWRRPYSFFGLGGTALVRVPRVARIVHVHVPLCLPDLLLCHDKNLDRWGGIQVAYYLKIYL